MTRTLVTTTEVTDRLAMGEAKAELAGESSAGGATADRDNLTQIAETWGDTL